MAIRDSDPIPPNKEEGDDADLTTGVEIKVGDPNGKYNTPAADEAKIEEATKVQPSGIPPLDELLPKKVSAPPTPSPAGPPAGVQIKQVIKIPGIALLAIAIILLAIAFTAGHSTARTQVVEQPAPPPKPGNTEYHTDDGSDDPSSEGLVGTTWALDAISKANTSIVWITNLPDVARIPEALRQKQNAGISILIIVGSSSNLDNAKAPLQLNLPVYRSPIRLESPQSLLYIDRKMLVDAARQQTAWSTTDPAIAKEIGDWINKSILPNCVPLHIETDPNLHP